MMMSKIAVRMGVLFKVALTAVYGFSPLRFLPLRLQPSSTKAPPDDLDTILRKRRTINNFEPNLPEDWEQTLETAIESATYAPNHKRTEPWRFHILGPKAIREICELNAEIVSKKKGEKAGQRKLERWLTMPGWVVVTCVKGEDDKNQSMEVPSSLAREDYAACCCAVQNLCLSLHNAGYGTKWTTGSVNFDPRFNAILKLEEDREYVVGTIWFGVPTKTPEAPPKKLGTKGVIIHHD